MRHYRTCLSIAGSDPSGGAGIQADLKTFAALGCYGAAAISALTVQNSLSVRRCVPVNARLVYEQAAAVMEDLKPDAIKIGMLGNASNVRAVGRLLGAYPTPFVVLDPILISSSGVRLLSHAAIKVLLTELMPRCTLITPNLPELKALTGETDPLKGAHSLLDMTACPYILVKGGHRKGKPSDILVSKERTWEFTARRVSTLNTHGTGCTLSSAIAAHVARGLSLTESIEAAKKYVGTALRRGANVKCGKGTGAMNHFFKPMPAVIEEV